MIASRCCQESHTSLARTDKARHTNKAPHTNRDSSQRQIPSPILPIPSPNLPIPIQLPNPSPILNPNRSNPIRPIRRASRSHRAKVRGRSCCEPRQRWSGD